MTTGRWAGACLAAGLAAAPLLAQQDLTQQASELPIVPIMVEASQDAAGNCTVATKPSYLSVRDGTRVAWHLVSKEGTTGCGGGVRLVVRDTEFRRRLANGTTGPDGSCQVTGEDQPGSSDLHRLRRLSLGAMIGAVRCKYTVRVFRGPSEIAMEDPDLEIMR